MDRKNPTPIVYYQFPGAEPLCTNVVVAEKSGRGLPQSKALRGFAGWKNVSVAR